jgi:hypothetical protein
MPVWVSALLAILVQILTKLLGYEVICRVLVALLEAWAKSSETKLDEKIFLAVADALGVPSASLKKLVEESEKPKE